MTTDKNWVTYIDLLNENLHKNTDSKKLGVMNTTGEVQHLFVMNTDITTQMFVLQPGESICFNDTSDIGMLFHMEPDSTKITFDPKKDTFLAIHTRLKERIGSTVPTTRHSSPYVTIISVSDIVVEKFPDYLSSFVNRTDKDKKHSFNDSTFNFETKEYYPMWTFTIKYGWKESNYDVTELYKFAMPKKGLLEEDDCIVVDPNHPFIEYTSND